MQKEESIDLNFLRLDKILLKDMVILNSKMISGRICLRKLDELKKQKAVQI